MSYFNPNIACIDGPDFALHVIARAKISVDCMDTGRSTTVLTEFSTMKAVMKHIVQSSFEKFGLHISRNRSGWDFLFEALRWLPNALRG